MRSTTHDPAAEGLDLRGAVLADADDVAALLEVTSAGHRTEAHAFYRACGFSDGALRFVKLLAD